MQPTSAILRSLNCLLILFAVAQLLPDDSFARGSQRSAPIAPPAISSSDIPVCQASRNQLAPAITSDGDRGVFLVWEDHRDSTALSPSDVYAAHVTKSGAQPWGVDGAAVCAASGSQFQTSLAPDDSGGIIVAWADTRNSGTTSTDIWAQRIRSNGTPAWTTDGVAVCTAADVQGLPSVIPDGAGGAVIIWQDRRLAGTPFPDHWSIFAQRLDGAGTPLWLANGITVQDSGRNEIPNCVSDGSGGIYVAWQQNPDPNASTPTTRISLARITSSGNVQWRSAVSTSMQPQREPTVTVDTSGDVFVAWAGRLVVTDPRSIYAMRILGSSGLHDPLWPSRRPATPGIYTNRGDQNLPVVAAPRTGGVIIAWNDQRQGADHVYGQKFSADASIAWPDTGVLLGGQPASGTAAFVITAVAGGPFPPVADAGAIVAWADSRGLPAGFYDLYAQSVDAGGNLMPGWGGTDALLVTKVTTRTQEHPAIATDMYDGAYIAWQDDRNYFPLNFDIYLARMRWDGATKVDVPQDSHDPVLRVENVAPNPMTRDGALRFRLRTRSRCDVSVVDMLGRRIVEVMDPQERDAGEYVATWNGRSQGGQPVDPGIYFIVIQAGMRHEVRRAVVLR